MKSASQIRQEFLDFFQEKGHTIVSSASLIPHNDPTLIFTNAGMNQFKDVFLGTGTRTYHRAADSQKCIRVSGKHNDLEEVGRDTYHHTFFEMLGNWSFGDYYKKEAIAWAWELLTGRWGLPKDKLYATVYQTDEEAESLWKQVTDILPDHIMRFGEKDNFWEMGDTGPCGPCSEIHIDLGPERCDKGHIPGHVCGVNAGCARYIELWNLVFIQYNRKGDGSLEELPAKHVDTGMGFERIVSVLQGQRSNYDIDLFRRIIQGIEEVTGQSYAKAEHQVAMRVIADHIRALTFAIADGALPSNDGRGYVLRRILRRAARFGRTLGMTEPFLYRVIPHLAEAMGAAYPELLQQQAHCELVNKAEEEGFNRTLDKGIELFESIAARLAAAGETTVAGEDAFKLYDTYGFPLDLTQLMAEERGLTVDLDGFDREMENQRNKARQSGKFTMAEDQTRWETLAEEAHSVFRGYEVLETPARLCLVGEDPDYWQLVFDQTPFYAESGGQVGDTGTIRADGREFAVADTVKLNDRIVHRVRKAGPFPKEAREFQLAVAADRRRATAANHTATHLLQAALRQVLGEHVHQSGSSVAPERLRFDFTHFEKITAEQLAEVESLVNRVIGQGIAVCTEETTHEEALAAGAMALFGEKYGDRVRLVRVPGFSAELCGGTHVANTAQIRWFRIVSESSVATGVRRIEAVTGDEAFRMADAESRTLDELCGLLKTDAGQAVARLQSLLDDLNKYQKELAKSGQDQAAQQVKELFGRIRQAAAGRYLVARVDGLSMELMREAVDKLRDQMGSGVAVLGAVTEGKVSFVVGVTKDLTGTVQAGKIIKAVAAEAGGGGGGRPDLAQAGGKDAAKVDQALAVGETMVKELLG
ncbi:alanyl-tRNA synthetase [Hydrogenispora ethanolica]|uniref:Alanine--tRNA ligase n=1 Tax=Hydrogenispora ethanolica TaxID=1082276 RepID=A0A4R1R0G1_HYDET|nr:alanine--tRNA ligase [Hydrogenispora ethanolica]TCL58793.1 alanyl-tRNA synthetase [Hydrogenispora ethanolica]